MTDEQIISTLGFETAGEEMRQRVIENIRTIVELRVIGVVSEAMTDEQQQTFESIRDSGDSEAMWKWLADEVTGVDVSEVYEATLKDYLDEYQENQANL